MFEQHIMIKERLRHHTYMTSHTHAHTHTHTHTRIIHAYTVDAHNKYTQISSVRKYLIALTQQLCASECKIACLQKCLNSSNCHYIAIT